MAIFEVKPQLTDTLVNPAAIKDPVARVSLNYSLSNNYKIHNEVKYDCTHNYKPFTEIEKDYQLAAAIAMFGMKLRLSKYAENASWNDIEKIALDTYNPNDYLQNEFIRLVTIAKKMYPKKKKKRWIK
jgi:Ca-activated chloride channel homolog